MPKTLSNDSSRIYQEQLATLGSLSVIAFLSEGRQPEVEFLHH